MNHVYYILKHKHVISSNQYAESNTQTNSNKNKLQQKQNIRSINRLQYCFELLHYHYNFVSPQVCVDQLQRMCLLGLSVMRNTVLVSITK